MVPARVHCDVNKMCSLHLAYFWISHVIKYTKQKSPHTVNTITFTLHVLSIIMCQVKFGDVQYIILPRY